VQPKIVLRLVELPLLNKVHEMKSSSRKRPSFYPKQNRKAPKKGAGKTSTPATDAYMTESSSSIKAGHQSYRPAKRPRVDKFEADMPELDSETEDDDVEELDVSMESGSAQKVCTIPTTSLDLLPVP
jgi:hypothetical protein